MFGIGRVIRIAGEYVLIQSYPFHREFSRSGDVTVHSPEGGETSGCSPQPSLPGGTVNDYMETVSQD